MPFQIRALPPDGVDVVWTGRLDLEEARAAIRELAVFDREHAARHAVLDFGEAIVEDLRTDDLATLVQEFRTAYPRGGDFRYVLVVSPSADAALDEYRAMRAAAAESTPDRPGFVVHRSRAAALASIAPPDAERPIWTIHHDEEGGLFLTWTGPFDLDELLASASALGAADPDQQAPYIVQDMSAMTIDAVGIEALHQLASRVATRFPRSSSFRSAIVGTGLVGDTFERYVEVRDLASARSPERLPELRVFGDLDEAVAWARSG